MHYYDDGQPQQRPLPALRDRPPRRRYVQASCPYCPRAVIIGLDPGHAADLLDIHQEAACPGPGGGDQNGADDHANDPSPDDVLRVT